MKPVKKTLLMAVVSPWILAACSSVHVGDFADNPNQDYDTVFGGISVGKGAKVRNVSTVNGGVEINQEAVARNVETVNGSIELGKRAQVRGAETVNGGIEAADNVTVEKSLATVNGDIAVTTDGNVGKNISTINGDILLDSVSVTGNVNTVNGHVFLRQGTRVMGDLVIEKNDGWFVRWATGEDLQKVVIDSDSAVVGTIHLYKKVELEIAEGAVVGEIKKHYSLK